MMDRKTEYAITVEALDRSYPDGWRSGHDVTDGLTVMLATGLRQILESMFRVQR